uniref:(northern house mosquito) hypothetical protein n=1 Tax=Culex pipiens TaxID=7175 RepID=A0A8D8ARU1_CULPI
MKTLQLFFGRKSSMWFWQCGRFSIERTVNTHRTIWDCFSNTDKHEEFHFSLQTTSIYRYIFFAILLATDWSAHALKVFLTFTRKRRLLCAVVFLSGWQRRCCQ